ncbi:MAG TPA: single-stranded DNA-binding protein, partial [Ruminococcus sp.]|nr:single-stranded DNA-binding protein [Ruminococcus sp.]
FTVAVNRNFADKATGERQADFIGVVAWKQTADFVAKYFKKGSMIIVEGNIQNNNYTDSNGVKHYSYNVIAEKVNFGESKSSAQTSNSVPNQAKTVPQTASSQVSSDLSQFEEVLGGNDLPF